MPPDRLQQPRWPQGNWKHHPAQDPLLGDDGHDDHFRHGGPVVTESREPPFQESPSLDVQTAIVGSIELRDQGAVDVQSSGFDLNLFAGKAHDALQNEFVAEPGEHDVAPTRRDGAIGPLVHDQQVTRGQRRQHARARHECQAEPRAQQPHEADHSTTCRQQASSPSRTRMLRPAHDADRTDSLLVLTERRRRVRDGVPPPVVAPDVPLPPVPAARPLLSRTRTGSSSGV